MAYTNVVGVPQVTKTGGLVEELQDYEVGEAYAAGDLIRLSAAGTIKLALKVSAGAVWGIALKDGVVGEIAKVVFFADDTVVSIPCQDSLAPSTLVKGLSYTIDGETGVWAVTSTSGATGVATVVGYPSDSFPFSGRDNDPFVVDPDVVNGRVLVRFKQTVLDAAVA